MSSSGHNSTLIIQDKNSIDKSKNSIDQKYFKHSEQNIANIVSAHLARVFLATHKNNIDMIIANLKRNREL
jgi:predicted negative regulator of RcsB-dependent stress response